jgi:hypothetical protein
MSTCATLRALHTAWLACPSPSTAKALGEVVRATLDLASAGDASAAGWENRLLALAMLETKAAAEALRTNTVLAALQRTMERVAVELEHDARAAFSGRTLQVALGALRVWIVRSDAKQGQVHGAACAALRVFASDPRHALRDAAQSALEGVLFDRAAAVVPPPCLAEDAVRLVRAHAAVQAQWLQARPRRVAGTVRTWVAALGAALGQRASRGAVNMLANALRPLLRSRDTALALDAHCAWVALVAGVCACGVEGSDARAAHLAALAAPLLKALDSSRVAVRRGAFYAWCAFAASAGASAAPPRAVAKRAVLPGLVRAARDADAELRAAALDALGARVGRSHATDDAPEAPPADAAAAAGEGGEAAAAESTVRLINRRLVRSLRAAAAAGENEGPLVDGRTLLAAARTSSLGALRGAVRGAAREMLRASEDAALCASVDERIAARGANRERVPVAAAGSASSGLSAIASSGSSSLSSPGAGTLAPSAPPRSSSRSRSLPQSLSLSRGVRRLRAAERGHRAFAAPSAGAASAPPVAPAVPPRLRAASSRRVGGGAAAYVAVVPKRGAKTSSPRKRRRVTANAALRYTTLEPSQMPEGSEDFHYG